MRRAAPSTLGLCFVFVAGVATVPQAVAGSFALREQSTAGQGVNFAGAAAGSAGLGSMYWNPATMTAIEGFQTQLNASGLFPYASIKPTTGTSPVLATFGGTAETGDIVPNALLPSGYAAYALGKWRFGLAVNSPYGLTTKDPTNFAGQIYSRTSSVRSYDFNPDVAYQLNDWLSIGAGLQVMYFKTRLSQATSPFPDSPSASLSGSDWAVGFTAGATIKPFAGTELGVGYRSSVGVDATGTLALGLSGIVPAKSPINLPDQVTVGLRQAVTRDLTLDAGYEWTRWSSLGTVTVTDPVMSLQLPFHYRNGSFVSGGAEYAYNQIITLKAGLGYEWSPITTETRDLRLPDADKLSVSGGASYKFSDAVSADFAYTHLFAMGNPGVDLVPGNPHYIAGLPFVGKLAESADIASVGVTVHW